MSDEVSVNTDGLLNAAGALSDVASRATGVYNSLLARLEELGQPWGEDRAGQAFDGQYEGPKEQLLTGMSSVGSVLDSAAQGVTTMARGYEATEEQNAASIRVGGGTGGDTGGDSGSDSHPGTAKP